MEKLEIQDEEIRDPIPGEYGHPIPREILFRELGFSEPYSRHLIGRRVVSSTLATKAVHTLCTKETINRRKFKLPTGARTTFHMAFSADGTKLASCHGDHNVYVCDVRNGEVLQTLSGHPRTPWCVVFHPTQNDVLASGCLAGHVRVWDLNGGSEVLVTDSGTVIASLAFHPTVRLLAIATFNEIIFWDWGLPHPLARCSTENTKEKVRLVRFDRLGKSLITGITNFPNPPVREAFQTTSNHRPNILSRGNARPNSVSYYIHERSDGDNRDVPVDVADDPVDRSNDPNSREMAEFAESFAAAAEAEAASAVLNRRQDRFQESYRQLVNHYQDLVTHYQQFLRSRIPRLLETSRIVREQPIIPVQNPQAQTSVEPEAESQHNPNPAATASNVGESSTAEEELPGPSRLMQLEARLLEIINTPESSDSTSQSSAAPTAEGSSIPTRLRNDTDLRNIEMLAQNILEMQNLCSQARRDAPLTIETQHIIELQNIRRHLELLQEQTRELQSSIRATLTSLARGSLDALRSHVTNTSTTGSLAASYARGSLDALRSHVTNGNNSAYPHFPSTITSTPGSPASNHSYSRAFVTGSANQSATGNPSNAILRITIGPRLTASAELIPPATSTGGSAPSNGPTRTQVPPAITMQYELPDNSFRSANSSATPADTNEPVAGTSRGTGRNPGEGNLASGPRRILREFQLFTGRGSDMEQHARNCPFSGRDQPQRPPPRMRCLAEMGEVPTLTVWPTIETGIELETRNFREIRRENTRIENRTVAYVQEPRIILDPLVSHLGGSGYNAGNPGNSAVSSYFNQWYVGGPNWISNDVGVHVFLTIRRVADNVRRSGNSITNEEPDGFEGENWQRLFPCGFAFIHPWARQGHRPDRRAHRREIRRGIFPCGSPRSRSDSNYSGFGRYGLWDDTSRSTSNSQPSTSSSSSSSSNSSASGETSQPARSTGRQLPQRINGNLTLIYYMRAGEEIIPVYSFSPENHDPNETLPFREGPLPHVFVFPIGLFLRGNAWENGTQTLGVYWPPVSRDEEQNLNEFRRSDALLPIFPTRTRAATSVQRSESYNNTRYRVTYNSEQTEIFLPRGGSIVMIQPGLLLLDAITSFAYFDRPRAAQGILFFDYVSPFLEALETLFGFRQRNSVLSGSSVSSAPSPGRASIHPGWVRPPNMPARWVNNNNQNQRQFLEATEPAVIRQEVNGMLVRRNIDPAFAAMYSQGQDVRGGLERIDRVLADRSRRLDDEEVGRTGGSNSASGGSSTRSGRWQASRDNDSQEANEGVNSTRRVIRLAVDTATADLLRRDHQNARGHITRAIESRIERVLNERGNRAQDNNEAYSPDRQLRLDDIQLRISMLAQWSQQTRAAGGPNSVTSGTQTSASFLRSSTQPSTSQGTSSSQPPDSGNPPARTSADTSVRVNRRRPYPEEQSSTTTTSTSAVSTPIDDDVLPSPSRIPRLTATYRGDESSERHSLEDENIIGFRERDWSALPSTSSPETSVRVIAGTSGSYPGGLLFPHEHVARNNSSTLASREAGYIYSRPGNPVVQTMDVDDDDDDDEDDEPPPLVRITTTPPPSSTSQTPEQPASVEASRERSTTPLSEEERVFEELIRDTTGSMQNSVPGVGDSITDGTRRQETNELERTFSRLISSLDRMPTTEPLLLRLRDVITPVGVSSGENVRRSGIPRVELNSPEMDELDGERESQLLLRSFENSIANGGIRSRGDWSRPDDGRMGSRLPAHDLESRNILIESTENPLLQTVGEATAREAIASIGLMPRVSPPLPNPVIADGEVAVLNDSVGVSEDTIPHVATIPYPYPFHGMNNEDNQRNRDSAFLGPMEGIEREIMERESARPTVSNSREAAASMNPLLRTIDEATARNAINSALSYPIESSLDSLQEPILQVESPAYPYQLYSRQNENPPSGNPPARPTDAGGRSSRARTTPLSTQFGEWLLRRQRSSTSHSRVRVTVRSSEASSHTSNTGSQELSGSARTRLGLSSGTGNSLSARFTATRNANPGTAGGAAGPSAGDQRPRPASSGYVPLPHPYVYRHPHHHFHVHHSAPTNNNPGDDPGLPQDSGARFYPGYIPEILITPRARPPTYYTMDAATTAFLSSRIQKWDFSNFYIPDITDRTSGLITASCSLHSDATLDVSSDSEFIAVLQPSDNGSYSAVGIYSLRDETLGESLYTYHFDQNTVSVSISPSCDYIVVGYAGRGPFYRIVHPSRNIGQILSLTREGQHVKLVPVKELFADTQPTLMSINCMHWVPIPGYGIIYGTNTGEVVLLS